MTRILLTLFAALALWSCSGSSDDAAPNTGTASPRLATRGVVPEYDATTFFQTTRYLLPAASGYAFSPDGADLLVSSDETGVFEASGLPVAGGDTERLTSSSGNTVRAISWFPHDRRILYQFDEGGNELNHIYVREIDGSSRDLTPSDGLKAEFSGWVSDGTAFYVRTTERDRRVFDLYRYNAEDYSRELVFENPGLIISAVSNNGRWLALEKSSFFPDPDVFLVDLDSDDKEPKLITRRDHTISRSISGFTPDDSRLIYLTDEFGEFKDAWAYDLETGKKSVLVDSDWDVLSVVYSRSGRYRAVGFNADASDDVVITDTRTDSALELPPLPGGGLASVRFSHDDTKVAFILDGSTSPSNVHVLDLATMSQMQLTNALNAAIKPQHLVDTEVVRYESYDGLEIPAILYKPHGASADNPAPALVAVHGGPGGQSRTRYNAMFQHLVNHGYAVLAANNRGSSGYGKTFKHLDDQNHGDADLGDIVEAKRYLASLPWVDGEKIGIIGGSYGGYMVVAALAFEPDVFHVGIDIFGVTNWIRTLRNIPPWWEPFKDSLYGEMGDPSTDEERLRAISPLFHAKNIRVPLLVVQGANDPRVLQVESDEIVEAVRSNGVPVEYIVFPDEGHGFRKRENRITASDAYIKFLDEHLRGEGDQP